jgi:hypothetical protein
LVVLALTVETLLFQVSAVPAHAAAAGTCVLTAGSISYTTTSISLSASGPCGEEGIGSVSIGLSGSPLLACAADVTTLGGSVGLPAPGPGGDAVSAFYTGTGPAITLTITGPHLHGVAQLAMITPTADVTCATAGGFSSSLVGSLTYTYV